MASERALEGKRIFIVEDDVTNMAVYSLALKQEGALILQDFWNSGTISLLKQNLPMDIILLDLMLRRGVSGYDIFARLQSDPQLASIPVVAVSASDPEIEIPRTQARGFAGFIGKPISPRDFPVQVAACMSGRHIWEAGGY